MGGKHLDIEQSEIILEIDKSSQQAGRLTVSLLKEWDI